MTRPVPSPCTVGPGLAPALAPLRLRGAPENLGVILGVVNPG